MKTKAYNNFLTSVDKQTAKLIDKNAKKLQNGKFGNVKRILTCNMNKKFIRPMYELTIDNGPGYRIYFSKNNTEICYLNAGLKKNQRKDIQTAKQYL